MIKLLNALLSKLKKYKSKRLIFRKPIRIFLYIVFAICVIIIISDYDIAFTREALLLKLKALIVLVFDITTIYVHGNVSELYDNEEEEELK